MASGDNNFTSFLDRYFKVFPYGRMIDTVVIAMMDKDHQESSWKKRKAPLQLVDPRREVKALRTGAKAAAATATMPPPAALVVTAMGMPSPGKAGQGGAARGAEERGVVAVAQ